MLTRLARKRTPDDRIKRLYEEKDYLDAYREHIDSRVEEDPHRAPGGRWDELGVLQFEFLARIGLRPDHQLLDIGCGTLRAGRHFVKYLDAGNYSGMDISPKAIEYARQLVEAEGLEAKRPTLVVTGKHGLRFEEFDGQVFNFLLAQSVFTHLKPEHIEECFQHLHRIMDRDSKFWFTFKQAPDVVQVTEKNFRYPFAFFEDLADQYGFELEDYSREYEHPQRQQMVLLRNPAGAPA